jgi:hypothetical protein
VTRNREATFELLDSDALLTDDLMSDASELLNGDTHMGRETGPAAAAVYLASSAVDAGIVLGTALVRAVLDVADAIRETAP